MIRTPMALLGAILLMPISSFGTYAANGPTPLTRTYVSGQGSDSNPCTAVSPCATFRAALAMTLAGGEIFVLNSADYGPVTITKAVSITSEGAAAGILANSGVGITISAGASDVVNLRGITIDGANTGAVGIQFVSGKSLMIQKSSIRNFTNTGVAFTPSASATLFVSDTVVTSNAYGGIMVASGSGTVKGALLRVNISDSYVGIYARGSGVSLAVTDAVVSQNSFGIASAASPVSIRNLTASGNFVGITADQPTAVLRVTQSTITGNGTGWQSTSNAQVQSYGNNTVGGNTNDGTATTTVALQ
jgi:hypothetical protein